MNPPPVPPPLPVQNAGWEEQRRRSDDDHLNLLAIFHLVWGLLAVIGLLGLWLHYTVFQTVFDHFPDEGFRIPAPPPGTSSEAPDPPRQPVRERRLHHAGRWL